MDWQDWVIIIPKSCENNVRIAEVVACDSGNVSSATNSNPIGTVAVRKKPVSPIVQKSKATFCNCIVNAKTAIKVKAPI